MPRLRRAQVPARQSVPRARQLDVARAACALVVRRSQPCVHAALAIRLLRRQPLPAVVSQALAPRVAPATAAPGTAPRRSRAEAPLRGTSVVLARVNLAAPPVCSAAHVQGASRRPCCALPLVAGAHRGVPWRRCAARGATALAAARACTKTRAVRAPAPLATGARGAQLMRRRWRARRAPSVRRVRRRPRPAQRVHSARSRHSRVPRAAARVHSVTTASWGRCRRRRVPRAAMGAERECRARLAAEYVVRGTGAPRRPQTPRLFRALRDDMAQ